MSIIWNMIRALIAAGIIVVVAEISNRAALATDYSGICVQLGAASRPACNLADGTRDDCAGPARTTVFRSLSIRDAVGLEFLDGIDRRHRSGVTHGG